MKHFPGISPEMTGSDQNQRRPLLTIERAKTAKQFREGNSEQTAVDTISVNDTETKVLEKTQFTVKMSKAWPWRRRKKNAKPNRPHSDLRLGV